MGVCPKCGSADVRRHCGNTSPQCDLIRCLRCHAYGTRDGRLWQQDGRK